MHLPVWAQFSLKSQRVVINIYILEFIYTNYELLSFFLRYLLRKVENLIKRVLFILEINPKCQFIFHTTVAEWQLWSKGTNIFPCGKYKLVHLREWGSQNCIHVCLIKLCFGAAVEYVNLAYKKILVLLDFLKNMTNQWCLSPPARRNYCSIDKSKKIVPQFLGILLAIGEIHTVSYLSIYKRYIHIILYSNYTANITNLFEIKWFQINWFRWFDYI